MSIFPRLKWKPVAELRRNLLPTLLEAIGIGLVVGGIWFLSPVGAMIVLGFVIIILAQALSQGRNKP
jgi:hypothetical protein